jgi:O-antigen ligase
MERLAFSLFLFVLLWSPLAFGAAHATAYTFLVLGVLAGSLLLAAGSLTRDRKTGTYRVQVPSTSLNLLFLLLLCYLLFQLIPLPGFMARFLSPEASVVFQKTLPASEAVAGNDPSGTWLSLSPYTLPVRLSLARWTAYGLFFLGLSRMLTTRKRIEKAVFAVLLLGCFESLYGIIQTFSGHEHIWWYKKTVYLGDVTGTYVNRNHFAGLMEITMMLAAVYAAALSERKRKREGPSAPKHYLRARISQWLSGEQRFNKRTFVLFAGVVMGIGLIFSASRGGMLAGAGGLLCISLFFLLRQGQRRKGLVILSLCAAISVYALAIGVDYPASRFGTFDVSMKERARYAQRALLLFHAYPLTGVGVGNFQHAYPKVQATEDRKAGIIYAHNDWAQFLAEAGLVGLCLFLLGISYYLYRTLRLWRQRRDPFAVCLGIGPVAALAAIGIHSGSDFNLHIPANFLMLTAVMAIGYSALHLERHTYRDSSFFPLMDVPLRYKGLLLLILLAALILWCGVLSMNHLRAEAFHKDAKVSSSGAHSPDPALLEAALEAEPGNALYWYDWAMSLRKERDKALANPDLQAEERRSAQMRIIRGLEEAVRQNPLREEYHIRLAWEYTYLWGAGDAQARWGPAADLSMERAAFFAGENNPYLHIMMGDYWLMRSKTVPPGGSQWESVLARARWHYRKNLSLETGNDRKRMLEHIRRNVWFHYPDEVFVKRFTE